jgi:flavin reductase (DIM6/NTAB) family NADH-FMN oxidoreductase RutF
MQGHLAQAIKRIPSGLFLLTAAYDGARSAVLVEWVQRCATSPPLVMAAVSTGLPVVPLIRDSRGFALCQLSEDDRFLARKFDNAPDHGDDPFDALPTISAPSGAPIVQRALAWLDCEVTRHIDLETDHGLYVGLVRAGGILNDGKPAVRYGGNGRVM